MSTTRLEAFSDGVIAIIITIMVLELKVPEGEAADQWRALAPLVPVLFTYLLSFVFLGTYWNNHHHMLHAAERISGSAMWANLHLLFWLSLVPFATGWMGRNYLAAAPTAFYGIVLLGAAVAYTILEMLLVADSFNERLRAAVGRDLKEKLSLAL
ncbi:MAG: TMEM175 family protein [Pirellulales bacterium]